jgi:hypothetical protein
MKPPSSLYAHLSMHLKPNSAPFTVLLCLRCSSSLLHSRAACSQLQVCHSPYISREAKHRSAQALQSVLQCLSSMWLHHYSYFRPAELHGRSELSPLPVAISSNGLHLRLIRYARYLCCMGVMLRSTPRGSSTMSGIPSTSEGTTRILVWPEHAHTTVGMTTTKRKADATPYELQRG